MVIQAVYFTLALIGAFVIVLGIINNIEYYNVVERYLPFSKVKKERIEQKISELELEKIAVVQQIQQLFDNERIFNDENRRPYIELKIKMAYITISIGEENKKLAIYEERRIKHKTI